MSSTADIHNPAIDNLIQSSNSKLEWIPNTEITNTIKQRRDYYFCHQTTYSALRRKKGSDNELFQRIILLSLGNDETCTPTFVSEVARVYSLPTSAYKTNNDDFKRYSTLLENRKKLIKGFVKHDGNYCMVANAKFGHYYDQYGFCPMCGILRCSPVWCICGHKKLSDGWTSNNTQLDDFIKKSQMQTNSANEAYLEWIPYDFIKDATLNCIPVELIHLRRNYVIQSFDFARVIFNCAYVISMYDLLLT